MIPNDQRVDAAVPHQMIFVQAMKGAPASVLLALAITGRFMTHKELQLWTRCGHSQVTMAVRQLEVLGCARARSSRGPWGLAEGFGVTVPSLFLTGSALKALNDNDVTLNSIEEETSSSSAPREHLRQVMAENGIEEPTASQLADLPYMTEEYILSHVHAARAKGLKLGAAIERMRLGGSAPPLPSKESADDKMRRFLAG